MIQFKKYSSIENSFNNDYLNKVKEQMPATLQYVVQEKVHGANTSFICDGTEVRFAKRTALLNADEKFFDFQEILARYRSQVMALYAMVKSDHPEVNSLTLFGELFGGLYPHPDVQAQRNVMLIQKGVCYMPGHEFYAFDLYLSDAEGNGRFLSVDEANAYFVAGNFFYARTLFQGMLDECLNYPNAFQSHIAEWLGLPALADNICEGVVIRPVVPMFLRNGARVLIKNKNERFSEKGKKTRNKNFADATSKAYSPALQTLLNEVSAYVTENRLTNVISHIGEVSMPQHFGKVTGMFSKDALDDFLKEYAAAYSALEKNEQKMFNKELTQLCAALVKKSLS